MYVRWRSLVNRSQKDLKIPQTWVAKCYGKINYTKSMKHIDARWPESSTWISQFSWSQVHRFRKILGAKGDMGMFLIWISKVFMCLCSQLSQHFVKSTEIVWQIVLMFNFVQVKVTKFTYKYEYVTELLWTRSKKYIKINNNKYRNIRR